MQELVSSITDGLLVSSQKYARISGDIAIPLFTKVVKEPCTEMMRKGRISPKEFDVNVTLIHQGLNRFVSRGKVGLATCT